MTRKIIQISAIPDSENNLSGVFALCDDGTLWWSAVTDDSGAWIRLRDIPQDRRPGTPVVTGQEAMP